MAVEVKSLEELLSKLRESASKRPVVLSFVTAGEAFENLVEFYNEVASSFDIQAILVQITNQNLRTTAAFFNVSRVPTTLFISGSSISPPLEGAEIPRILSGIQSLTASFSDSKAEELAKIQVLLSGKPLLAFINGIKQSPQSLQSKKMLRILNGFDFSAIDVSNNLDLLIWLPEISGSSNFPQYFVNGKYQGNIESLVEQIKTGELSKILGQNLEERIRTIIGSSKYMIFMMGSREEPICGFSKRLIELLGEYKVDFETFDISFDSEVCEGLKKISDWPTYPQVYVNGELIGGYDVCVQMHNEGELRIALKIE